MESLSERPSVIAAMVPAAKESPAPLTALMSVLSGRKARVSPPRAAIVGSPPAVTTTRAGRVRDKLGGKRRWC